MKRSSYKGSIFLNSGIYQTKRPRADRWGKMLLAVCVAGLLVALGLGWMHLQTLNRSLSVEKDAAQELQVALDSEARRYKAAIDEIIALKNQSKDTNDIAIEQVVPPDEAMVDRKQTVDDRQVEDLTRKVHDLEDKLLTLTRSYETATKRLSEAERDRGKMQRSRSTLREKLRAIKHVALQHGLAVPAQSVEACSNCPRHLISLPSGAFSKNKLVTSFDIGRYEVTQREWQAVMGDNPSHVKGELLPVTDVSWSDVQTYLKKLNEIAGLSDQKNSLYRLPTASEWEYAAHAGESAPYFWGHDIGANNANCASCGSKWDKVQPAPVGSFKTNRFGLFDMSGNVYEWVDDCKRPEDRNFPGYSANACVRSARGGSFLSADVMATSTQFVDSEEQRVFDIGFRLARSRTIR